jgi:hypothetical protein
LGITQRYAHVAFEFGKEVARREQLHLPSISAWPQASTELQQGFRAVMQRSVVDWTPSQVGRFALLGVEVAGFFCIGEIIARGQVAGYKH